MIEKLKSLLLLIKDKKPEGFNGLGIVLYSSIETLPISPLRQGEYLEKMPVSNFDLIIKYLIEVSLYNNNWHDGFHLISEEFHLTHFCQYFSTPIVEDAPIEFTYGSRYRTALYGSYLKDVIACGVISSNFDVAVFRRGNKIII